MNAALPPHSREAEIAVLGAMMRDNTCIGRVLQIVRHAEYFYHDSHQRIFRAIVSLFDAGKPVDAALLADHLRDQIEDCGGYEYLLELWGAVATSANAEYYAGIVRDKSQVRSLQQFYAEAGERCKNQVAPADDLLAEDMRGLLAIAERGTMTKLSTMREMLARAQDRYDARRVGDLGEGLTTGFAELDTLIKLRPGELVIVGARPSAGKTAFALSMILHVAVKLELPTFFASLEQGEDEITDRLLAAEGSMNTHLLRLARVSDDQFLDTVKRLRDGRLYLDDSPGQTVLRIAANARLLRMKQDLRAVFVDYLQLIEPEERRSKQHEELAVISRRLKALARELRIPIIALAQLNRDAGGREPKLSDLRGSGDIEQDADVVLLLHSPAESELAPPDAIKVIVAKHRNGPRGELALRFRKEFVRFENLPPIDEPALPLNGVHEG